LLCCCFDHSLCPYLSASVVLLQSQDREKWLPLVDGGFVGGLVVGFVGGLVGV
jgi:hypothetical protein